MDQITTLCGIEACAIISGPNELHPQVWPPHFGVQRVIYKFMKMPETDQGMKMLLIHESFLNQSFMKTLEKLKELKKMRVGRKRRFFSRISA
ncbi:hypothetical protein Lal_00001417 [Lupinus albus]|nr:hypothetical protein Lal_00001239 [Lupinus albus]KAF1891274.1 hypothetical protein Lal_00001417 [Lupinus albus]